MINLQNVKPLILTYFKDPDAHSYNPRREVLYLLSVYFNDLLSS